MTYFIHKKSKKLIELVKEENNVFTVKEFGGKDEKKMKAGLFNKIFEPISDEDAEKAKEKIIAIENEKIKAQQEKEANRKERTPRTKKAPAVRAHETDRYKELVKKHVVKNIYELEKTGQEVHTMLISPENREENVTLSYRSFIKMRHDGIARTAVTFNGSFLADYNNLGIGVVADDFCADIGISSDDLAFLMMTLRRRTIADNKETYTIDEIKAKKEEWLEFKKAETAMKKKQHQEMLDARKAKRSAKLKAEKDAAEASKAATAAKRAAAEAEAPKTVKEAVTEAPKKPETPKAAPSK